MKRAHDDAVGVAEANRVHSEHGVRIVQTVFPEGLELRGVPDQDGIDVGKVHCITSCSPASPQPRRHAGSSRTAMVSTPTPKAGRRTRSGRAVPTPAFAGFRGSGPVN